MRAAELGLVGTSEAEAATCAHMLQHNARLLVLYDAVDARVNAVNGASDATGAEWLCRRGCDTCCHRLAEVPSITANEWQLLASAIEGVPEHHARFETRMGELAARVYGADKGPVVCPFLALDDGEVRPGSCLVYEGRPAACRTYGYYTERGDVLGCSELLVQSEALPVTWGNHQAVLRELDALCTDVAPRRSIVAWWSERAPG